MNGSYTTTSSSKADEDDQLTEVLEKHGTDKAGERILSKDNACEAAVELMENKGKADNMDAMDHVKTVFAQVWVDHDIQNRGFINYNEGFVLMQDLVTKMQ